MTTERLEAFEVTPESLEQRARAAYEVWVTYQGGRPSWASVPEKYRETWRQVAKAVLALGAA